MEFLWLIIVVFAVISRIAESSKKQSQRRNPKQPPQPRPVNRQTPRQVETRQTQRPGTQGRAAPRPGQQQPEGLQDLIRMFLGEDQEDPTRTRNPQSVRRQQVVEGQWKEERLRQEQQRPPEEAGTSQPQDQPEEQERFEDPQAAEDLTMYDLSLGEVGDAPDDLVDTASAWTLQEAARGIVWHEILSGPRSMKGKKYGWRR